MTVTPPPLGGHPRLWRWRVANCMWQSHYDVLVSSVGVARTQGCHSVPWVSHCSPVLISGRSSLVTDSCRKFSRNVCLITGKLRFFGHYCQFFICARGPEALGVLVLHRSRFERGLVQRMDGDGAELSAFVTSMVFVERNVFCVWCTSTHSKPKN